MQKKILIAHISKQHSFHTAIALKKAGYLHKYVTTVYDKPGSMTRLLKKRLKGVMQKKAESRSCEQLDDQDIIQFYEWLGLLRIFLNRFKWINIDIFLMRIFAKRVVRFVIKEQVDALIVYDGICSKYLKQLKQKAPQIITIMDVTIAARPYMKEIFEKDMEQFNHQAFFTEEPYLWKGNYFKEIYTDFEYTDYFLVASEFVRKSLHFCKIPDKKILKVPYGVDVTNFSYNQKQEHFGPLKLLFVGNLSYRKGLHHLLKIISLYDKDTLLLRLAGGYNPNGEFYKSFSANENIEFLGFVTRDKITETFQESDLFVLPSLAEGFALVILEALATGTPVLCSSNTGGNDAINNYENGLVFEASNFNLFQESIEWVLLNRDKLPLMSQKAREKSMKYTWDKYYTGIIEEINNIFN